MLRRIAIGLISVGAVTSIGVVLWVATHRSDLPAPNDSDLDAPSPAVAADEDGYQYLQRAAGSAKLTFEKSERVRAILRGAEPDAPWAARLVEANRPAFRELERAIAAPAIVVPDPVVVFQSHAVDPMLTVQMLVQLAALDARQHLRAGDPDGALAASRLGLRLGASLGRAQRPGVGPISAMFALTFENISLRALDEILRARLGDAQAALELSRELDSYRLTTSAWQGVWFGEYQSRKALLEKIRVPRPDPILTGELSVSRHVLGALPDGFLWQPNRTLAEFAAFYRGYAAAFSGPCRPETRASLVPSGNGEKRQLLLAMLHGNALGAVLTSLLSVNFERLNTRRCHTEARLSLAQALVALEAYRAAEGQLPDSLEALVPRYLDRVPTDAFGGQSLRFDRARGLVYSVGSDFAPTTGESAPSPEDQLEPASYVSPPAPADPGTDR